METFFRADAGDSDQERASGVLSGHLEIQDSPKEGKYASSDGGMQWPRGT